MQKLPNNLENTLNSIFHAAHLLDAVYQLISGHLRLYRPRYNAILPLTMNIFSPLFSSTTWKNYFAMVAPYQTPITYSWGISLTEDIIA